MASIGTVVKTVTVPEPTEAPRFEPKPEQVPAQAPVEAPAKEAPAKERELVPVRRQQR